MKKELQDIIANGGNWNTIYNYLRRKGITYTKETIEFGLHPSKTAQKAKNNWIESAPENEFRAHRYSLIVKSRKNGYSYNRIFAQSIKFN